MLDLRPAATDRFNLRVPAGWNEPDLRPEAQGGGVIYVVVEPVPETAASVVVTAETLEQGTPVAAWQEKAEADLAATLIDYLLLDLATIPLGQHRGVRRLATHVASGRPVSSLQYVTVAGAHGWTVTCTVSNLRFAGLRDTFEAVGASFRPREDL